MMKKDITTRDEIYFIIDEFYKKLLADATMYPFFEEIVKQQHLENHINTITDFWQDILFYTNVYHNNVMKKHMDFHQKIPFKKEHFTIWLTYLKETIDTYFEGQNANNMKDRATSIAIVMQVKMNVYQQS